MKRLLTTTAAAAIALGGAAFAQDAGETTITDTTRFEVAGTDVMAGDLIGMRLYAAESGLPDEEMAIDLSEMNWIDMGEINDLVVNRDGTVEAVIVGVGGLLGIGEKEIAVPAEEIAAYEGDEGMRFLVIEASEQDLADAPEFDTAQLAEGQALAGDTGEDATLLSQAGGGEGAARESLSEEAGMVTDPVELGGDTTAEEVIANTEGDIGMTGETADELLADEGVEFDVVEGEPATPTETDGDLAAEADALVEGDVIADEDVIATETTEDGDAAATAEAEAEVEMVEPDADMAETETETTETEAGTATAEAEAEVEVIEPGAEDVTTEAVQEETLENLAEEELDTAGTAPADEGVFETDTDLQDEVAVDEGAAPDEGLEVAGGEENEGAMGALVGPAVTREGYQTLEAGMVTADELTGADVYGLADEDLGDIEDLIVAEDGTIEQAIIGVGGFLGIGEHRVAVPFQQLTVLADEGLGDVRVYIDATEETLEGMEEWQG